MNAHIDDWSDIYVASLVAKKGTLSGAADLLDVHHSTVLRRVNGLEKKLNTRLFHRHARGYTPTEAGQLLFKVAENTQDEFDRLLGKLQGADEQLCGKLVITCLSNMMSKLMPVFHGFQQEHPNIRLEIIADHRLLKLEYGEAHISIRAGRDPQEPDYVAQHVADMAHTLAASASYIKRFGSMDGLADLSQHRFIGTVKPLAHIPFMRWLHEQVPEENVVMRVSDFSAMREAIAQGVGVAPVNCWTLSHDSRLIRLLPAPGDWSTKLWLVTHKDMHRTGKVKAFTAFFKQWIQKQLPFISES